MARKKKLKQMEAQNDAVKMRTIKNTKRKKLKVPKKGNQRKGLETFMEKKCLWEGLNSGKNSNKQMSKIEEDSGKPLKTWLNG